jgi:ribonuclease/clavin/mitogillin
MTSLKTLLALKPGVLYPAHGPHIPGHDAARAHIQKYISHRQDREDQILAILKTASEDPQSTTKALQALVEKHETDAITHAKYKEEFMTGLPEKEKDIDETKEKAKAAAKAEALKKLEVEGGVKVVSLDNLCRQIYNSMDEKLLFAAKKSITAHLDKLVKEGKVKKDKAENPVIEDAVVEDRQVIEGFVLA